MKKYDVVALGELLIDFTENGVSEQATPCLKLTPVVHHVMCLQCCQSWAGKPRL